MKKFIKLLKKKSACEEGLQFVMSHKTAKAAWDACKNPDWMLWALDEFGLNDDKKSRLFACWCARNTPISDGETMWDLLTDERSRNAVIVAERFARDEATSEELDAARAAARAATWAATRAEARAAARAATWAAARAEARAAARAAAWDAARAATWAAAWDAARAAARDAAWDATWDAARDATWDATWDAAWDAAWDATWAAARTVQAKALRDIYGFPFKDILKKADPRMSSNPRRED